ncbi:monocarboxylate transporter 12-like, partial [Ixodes scapularis]|uniref:monocarboxylate transporter 12-like n=1 Tax=Ixodes scapularis TaxID=6945 RepID=UPI001A9F5B18
RFQQYGFDSIQSWLTAGACALTTFFAVAPLMCSGFFYVTIMNEFNVSHQEASWTIMILGGARVLSGLLAAFIGHRFTARPLIIFGAAISSLGVMFSCFAHKIWVLDLTLGAIHGFGSGIVYAMNPVVISEHFDKYTALATGMNFAGLPLGSFIFPKLLEQLVQAYGFHGAMLIFGSILLNALAFSLFLRRPSWLVPQNHEHVLQKSEESKSQGANEPYTISGTMNERGGQSKQKVESMKGSLVIFKAPVFYVIAFSFIAFCLSYDCYNSLFLDFSIGRGIIMSNAVTLTSICSLADLAGRLILPALNDKIRVERKTFVTALLVLLGGLYISMSFASGFWVIFTLTMAIAALLGCGVVLFPMLLVEHAGLDNIFMATGMLTALTAVFLFLKPILIGYFRGSLGGYDFLFVACGCGAILASLMWAAISAVKCTTERHKWTIDHENDERDISDGTYVHISWVAHKGDGNRAYQRRKSVYTAALVFY